MLFEGQQVMEDFRLYTRLALKGYGDKEVYLADDVVRGLVEEFAQHQSR